VDAVVEGTGTVEEGSFVSTTTGVATGLEVFTALAAGTRRRNIEVALSDLGVTASEGALVCAAGGFILILLVNLLGYSGKLCGGGRSDIKCLK
jgi:hypothetical protein